EGVNAGLAALRVRPWPYLLLRQTPQPWTTADSALAGHEMYFDLLDSGNARELALWKLRPHLPAPLFDLLTHPGSQWDARLLGDSFGDADLPSAEQVDLRRLPQPENNGTSVAAAVHIPPSASQAATFPPAATGYSPGNNNFAVSGALTADGRAIVADD